MKACVDCRHYDNGWGRSCRRFTTFDPVLGHQPTYPPINRLETEVCGPEAKGFQPKRSLFDILKFWRTP